MQLTTSPIGTDSLRTAAPASSAATGATPTPPERWARWWTSPIALFTYGEGSRVPLWSEAIIPADRGLTGALRPAVTYAGRNLEAAIEAAHVLAKAPVELSFSYRNGRLGTAQVNPAIAVLRDAHAGVYWLAPMHTTVRRRDQWLDAPHTIDGAAFTGADPLLARPQVLTATRDLVAVVGATDVIRPGTWADAPDDSKLDD
ncbi:MAG: hypothetical protein KDC46_03370 [Thermoleophilia bacterium]|nr:hypothetical protein [Thermoleophilia bacterium]